MVTTGTVDGWTATIWPTSWPTPSLHSGTQDHPIPENTVAVFIDGTFQGAPGRFRCTGDRLQFNQRRQGQPERLGRSLALQARQRRDGDQPDTTYLYYGWWVSKDDEDMPTAASAFTGTVFPTGGTAPVSVDLAAATLEGSATYEGNAAGKFAMSNPLDGTGSGGHFTADATLTAKLGAIAAPNNGGISGMLDNFMANDESVPWSVELHLAPWGTDCRLVCHSRS